jgi:hypothetical protein
MVEIGCPCLLLPAHYKASCSVVFTFVTLILRESIKALKNLREKNVFSFYETKKKSQNFISVRMNV